MSTFYLSGLKKTWPVSKLLLVSVLQGMCVNLLIIIILKHYYYFTSWKSASCTHISALLHALAAMTPVPFPVASSSIPDDEDADSVPITLLPCQWKQPRK